MIFKCKNCGGNSIYDPEKMRMYCPYCDSLDSEEKQTTGVALVTCVNCGGEVKVGPFTSASRCPYCDNYIIYDERVSGIFRPNIMIPFKLGKEQVKKLMRDNFAGKIFAPTSFLSEAKLNEMNGMYVPFWMYDYRVTGHYEADGKKIRTWIAGDREYTETSIYHIVRDMDLSIDKMPIDASDAMPDAIMDLMEPYDYSQLMWFDEKYVSGFFAEMFNQDADTMEPRAKDKAGRDAVQIMNGSISGYTSLTPSGSNYMNLQRTELNYALMPVWIYIYKYAGQDYRFYINGQTGKVVGKVPVSKGKVWAYGATLCAGIITIGMLLRGILMML